MNNKGITTGSLVVIILGLFVVLLIVTGPLKVGYDYASEKFFGEHSLFSTFFRTKESEFKPYAGANVQMSPEEVTVDNSVKALICAVNSLALGKPGWLKKDVCPEGFQNNTGQCAGVLYGQSCVECNTNLGVKEVVLDELDVIATKQLVDEMVSCWNKFKANKFDDIWCSHLSVPATTSYSSWYIRRSDLQNVLDKQGLADFHYVWFNLQNNPIVLSQNFYVCGRSANINDVDSVPEILLTFNKNACSPKLKSKENEFACFVNDFELPQDLGSSIPLLDFAQELMAQFKDPQYLVYYESFPRGEAAAWQINPGSFVIDVVLFGSVMNVVPAVGMYGGKLLSAGKGLASRSINKILGRSAQKETAEQLVKKAGIQITKDMSEASLREFLSSLSPEGYEALMRSERLYTKLYSSLPSRLPEELESLRYGIFRQYSAYKAAGKNPDEIVFLLGKDIDAGAFGPKLIPDDRAAVSKAMESFVRNPLSDVEMESLKKSVSVKQFFVKNLLNDAGDGIDAKAFDDLFKNLVSAKTVSVLSDEAAEQLAKRSADIAEAGIVDLSKPGTDIWRSSVLGPGVVRDLEKVAVEIEQSSGDAFQRFLMGVSADDVGKVVAAKGGVLPVAWAGVKQYSPITVVWKQSVFSIQRPVLLRSLAYTVAKTPVKGTELAADVAYVALWRPRAVRYSLAVAIGMAIAQADAANEKYRFRGGDSIVLQKPYLYEKNKVYSLSKSTSDYFLSLFKFDKGGKGYSRFFLASPCKADVLVSRTRCSCEIKIGDSLLYSTLQPVQPESVIFNESGREKVSLFEKEFKVNQREFELACLGKLLPRSQYPWSDYFRELCAETLVKNSDVYSRFTREYYDKAYLPAFRFLKNNNLFDTADEFIARNKPYYVKSALKSVVNAIEVDPSMALLRADPDFAFFSFFVYPVRSYAPGQQMDVEDAISDMNYPALVDGSDHIRRTAPLEYKVFVDVLNAGLYVHSSVNPKDILGALLVNFPGQKNGPGTLASVIANNTYLNYYFIHDEMKAVDKSNVAKICEFSDKKDISGVFEQYDFNKARVSIPCFNAQVNLESGYNNDHNYCYTGDMSYIANLKWILTGVAVVIDVGAGIAGFGIGEIPMAILTGTASAWAGHELDKQQWWPNH